MVGVIPFDSTLFNRGTAPFGSASTAPPVEADSSPGTLILHGDQSQEPVPLTRTISFVLHRQTTPTHLSLWSTHDCVMVSGQKENLPRQFKNTKECNTRNHTKETLSYTVIKTSRWCQDRLPCSANTPTLLDVLSTLLLNSLSS